MKCPLCTYDATDNNPNDITEHWVDCKNCGKFSYSDNTLPNDRESRAKLSHAVRKAQGTIPFELTADFIKEKSKHESYTVVEQIDNLIIHIGKTSSPGNPLKDVSPKIFQALVGSTDEHCFYFIVDAAVNDFKYIAYPDSLKHPHGLLNAKTEHKVALLLTAKGWQHYEELKRGTSQSHKAFMAMDFKNKILDEVFKKYFVPAVKETGFALERVDSYPKAGLIDDKIRVDIRNSRFIIADLSDGNNGAYWEAGYAEGLGKPVIYTCEKKIFDDNKTKPHFDTNHHYTIVWEKDNLENAAKSLKSAIRATFPDEAKMTDDEGQ